MRPGMPPGRKHFRRSRDAPKLPIHAKTGRERGPISERPGTSPSCQRTALRVAESGYHTKYLMLTKGAWIRENRRDRA